MAQNIYTNIVDFYHNAFEANFLYCMIALLNLLAFHAIISSFDHEVLIVSYSDCPVCYHVMGVT